jgi:serine/threonine protein kinase
MLEKSPNRTPKDAVNAAEGRTQSAEGPTKRGPAAPLPVAPSGYVLGEELGRGGMGVVYRARDLALDREVAVKLLRDGYGPASAAARRFLEEAHITGQLQHPGIPAVYQTGTAPDGRPFLAMKLVKGRTLADLLENRDEGPADRSRFLPIFEQVCQAVGYAHAHAVIHRDLKPSNIMVGAFGEVQVMDWGLAKVVTEGAIPEPSASTAGELEQTRTAIGTRRDAGLATEAGSLLGTPAFMSPEQAGGETDKIGPPSDVFGLGAILCVILTGHPPYRAAGADAVLLQAIRGQLDDAFARLDACDADPEVVALARRCLAGLAERPADGAEVAEAVARLRAAAEERARRAELERAAAEVRTAELRKRRKVWFGLAASRPAWPRSTAPWRGPCRTACFSCSREFPCSRPAGCPRPWPSWGAPSSPRRGPITAPRLGFTWHTRSGCSPTTLRRPRRSNGPGKRRLWPTCATSRPRGRCRRYPPRSWRKSRHRAATRYSA